MVPLLLETPSSVAWRVARTEGMSLDEFVRFELRFDCNELHGDLDRILSKRCQETQRAAAIAGVVAQSRGIPDAWLRKTWDHVTRTHRGRVYFCPDCLRFEPGCAKWTWRMRFTAVCPTHERYLVGSCSECGEVFRYRVGIGATIGVHWLDAWAYCPSCGCETKSGSLAPSWLKAAATKLEKMPSEDDGFQKLAIKLAAAFYRQPSLLRECSEFLGLPDSSDVVAGMASAMIFAFSKGKFIGSGEVARELRFFALTGMPFSANFAGALGRGVSHSFLEAQG